uniref:Uncharacterized protein n=1 Tax=Anguilla anguilla TaxID=7936 RepID=A0A0E9PBS6_ANGAN
MLSGARNDKVNSKGDSF